MRCLVDEQISRSSPEYWHIFIFLERPKEEIVIVPDRWRIKQTEIKVI